MQTNPLSNLIRNRLFDRSQDGLESRFAAYKFKYQLTYGDTYGEPTDKSLMYLDFEYKNLVGRMTVWESGECDLEVMEDETEKSILWKHYQLKDERAFYELLANFFLYFRDGKNLPSQ